METNQTGKQAGSRAPMSQESGQGERKPKSRPLGEHEVKQARNKFGR